MTSASSRARPVFVTAIIVVVIGSMITAGAAQP